MVLFITIAWSTRINFSHQNLLLVLAFTSVHSSFHTCGCRAKISAGHWPFYMHFSKQDSRPKAGHIHTNGRSNRHDHMASDFFFFLAWQIFLCLESCRYMQNHTILSLAHGSSPRGDVYYRGLPQPVTNCLHCVESVAEEINKCNSDDQK